MKYTITIASLVLIILSATAQQPGRLTKKFFPEPTDKLTTPAFERKLGFTNYKALTAFIEELKTNDFVRVEYIGQTQRGKNIPVVYISKPSTDQKVRVWMQGGIHGNEPASSEGMLAVLQELLEPQNEYLLDRLDVAIAPMVNIDGYMRQNRLDKKGLDMNRDLMKLQIPEIQQLKKVYEAFEAHVSIDFHEYNPFRRDYREMGRMGYTGYYDAMFLYTGDLNVEPKIRELTEDLFVKKAKARFDELNFTHRNYFSPQNDLGRLFLNEGGSSARSSATSFALANSVSILMEIRGIRLNRNSFERRVLITKETGFSYLRTAHDHADEVLNGVQAAIESTLNADRKIVVTSQRTRSEKPIKFIDIASNEVVEHPFEVASVDQMTPGIVRERPVAYILGADQLQAARNLEILGLNVETLATNKRLKVETYLITKQHEVATKYQGYYPSVVKTNIVVQEMDFPAGTLIVRLNQRNANLAVTALEPESDDGFVKTRVIDAKRGDILPIYRLMNTLD